jgi:hypothetical protein
MRNHWRPFLLGAACMLIGVSVYFGFFNSERTLQQHASKSLDITIPAADAVTITPLKPLQFMRGDDVPFEGKVELRQVIVGRFAKNLDIVNFQATGEHAEKSVLRIVWENGEVEKIYPGTKGRKLLPEKRAKEITIIGYSMYERRIFKDSSRKGSLTWEIRYEPVEI